MPDSLGSTNVRRLFEDHPAEERAYLRRTGVFPIMHTIVLHEDLHAAQPWVAQAMYDAFVESKRRAIEWLRHDDPPATMLPWQLEASRAPDDLSLDELWAYGLEPNRVTLETLMGYLVDQGFLAEPAPIDEMFVPVEESRV